MLEFNSTSIEYTRVDVFQKINIIGYILAISVMRVFHVTQKYTPVITIQFNNYMNLLQHAVN